MAQPMAQSMAVAQSVAVAQPVLQLGQPSMHGGTSSANSALGDAYRTGGLPNVPMGLPVEAAVPTKSCGAASSSSATTPMPPLNQACEEFKRELGVGGANLAEVVDAACEMLGISDTKGLSLMEKAQKCWTSLKG